MPSASWPAATTLRRESDGASLHRLSIRLDRFSNRVPFEELDSAIMGGKRFFKDQPAWADRIELSHLAVMEDGWAYKFTILPGGRRHIADIFGPGAIVNWSRLSSFEEQHDIMFKGGSRVTFLDKKAIEKAARNFPALDNVLRRHELARTMRTAQRVRALVSMTATEKMLVMLLDIRDELRASGLAEEQMTLPFTQAEMADLLGLTSVHVSRTLKKVETDGYINRVKSRIEIPQSDALQRALDYRAYFREKPKLERQRPKMV